MTHSALKELRFAAYMRVSEDEQRDYGQSLATQRSRITAAVEQLGGKIVAFYGGSEHGTPGYVRDEFDRMMEDTGSDKFNAICIADLPRWARDTVAHEQAMRRLKHCRIRFFVGPTEYDLRNAGMQIALTLATKSSETETSARMDASAYGRIERAALGFVTSGSPPYGRSVPATLHGTRRIWKSNSDGTAKWQVDQQARSYVERAAKAYLGGKPWGAVAEGLGDDENTVRRRVRAAGGIWQQRFGLRDYRPEDFVGIRFYDRLSFEGNHVTVTIPIPPLLDEVTLRMVRAKAASHYVDYKARNKQALGGYMRCLKCDRSIGTHFHVKTGAIYMQHNGPRRAPCPANLGRYEPFERSVFGRLAGMFQAPGEVEACVKEALLAETTRQPELEHRRQVVKAEHAAFKREHDDLFAKMKAFDLGEGGAMTARFAADVNRLDAQLRAKDEEIKRLEQELKVTRLPPDFSARVEFTLFCLRGYGTGSRWLWTWPAAQRRELVQFLFGHPSRKPLPGSKATDLKTGIYLTRKRDEQSGKSIIEWEANGWFPQVSNTVWLDPKIVACYRPAAKGGAIDRKRLVQLIRRLDFEQFGWARLLFNARKPEGRPKSA